MDMCGDGRTCFEIRNGCPRDGMGGMPKGSTEKHVDTHGTSREDTRKHVDTCGRAGRSTRRCMGAGGNAPGEY